MSISPVDMQVMMSKTTEVASKHSAELHKAVSDQQNVSKQETQRQEDNTKKVHDRNTAERIYVDEEDNNKNKQEKEKKKSNSKEENENGEDEKDFPKDLLGRHFDASI